MSPRSLSTTAMAGVAVLAGLAALAGCSGGGGTKTSSTGYSEQDRGAVAVGKAPVAAAAGSAAAGGSPAQRAVVRTASISVTAADVDAAADRVTKLAGEQGGRVEGDERSGTDSRRTATLTVRVLPTRLETTMTVVAALGRETGRSLQAQDVTDTKVDLDARTAALSTSVTRLRQLLRTSSDVGSLLAVEKQLSSREADLEALQAKRTSLANQVSLASLTVSLYATAPPAVKPRTGVHPTGFVSAFGSGVHAVAVGLRLAAAGLGYSLPVLVPLVLLLLLAWRLRPRSAPSDPAAPSTTGPDESQHESVGASA